jgi:hypothetical protein
MVRRGGKLQKIAGLVRKVYPSQEPAELMMARVFGAWAAVVSSRVLSTARPMSLRNGMLTIHTATTAHADGMQYETDRLLIRLRALVPEARLKAIRFKVGELPALPPPPPEERKRKPLVPVAQLPESVAAAIANIRNEGIREAVAKAAAVGLAPRRDDE